MFFVGFDPGGKSGVALLRVEEAKASIFAFDVTSVREAIDWCTAKLDGSYPRGIGVDAFLHWSVSKSGWRAADIRLRERYVPLRNSIICSNSTYGSMAIQGMAFAMEASRLWPQATVNEVHPKIIFSELAASAYERDGTTSAVKQREGFWNSRDVCFEGKLESEHQFDAALGAWVTFRAIKEGYPDLIERTDGDLLLPLPNVKYFWPV
jgi:hypothetical protein